MEVIEAIFQGSIFALVICFITLIGVVCPFLFISYKKTKRQVFSLISVLILLFMDFLFFNGGFLLDFFKANCVLIYIILGISQIIFFSILLLLLFKFEDLFNKKYVLFILGASLVMDFLFLSKQIINANINLVGSITILIILFSIYALVVSFLIKMEVKHENPI